MNIEELYSAASMLSPPFPSKRKCEIYCFSCTFFSPSLHPHISISITPFTTRIPHLTSIISSSIARRVQSRPGQLHRISLSLLVRTIISVHLFVCIPLRSINPMYFVHLPLPNSSPPSTKSLKSNQFIPFHPITTSKKLSHPRYAMQRQKSKIKPKVKSKVTREDYSQRDQALKWNLSASSLPNPSLGATYRLR